MIPDQESTIQQRIQTHIVARDIKDKSIFSCRISGCDTSCTTSSNIKRHELLHYGEKAFDCVSPGCGKKFARKYDLKVHTRIHTKERPYECEYVNCGRTFSRTGRLLEHQRIVHHKIKITRQKINRSRVIILNKISNNITLSEPDCEDVQEEKNIKNIDNKEI